jgi:hypothetical protein
MLFAFCTICNNFCYRTIEVRLQVQTRRGPVPWGKGQQQPESKGKEVCRCVHCIPLPQSTNKYIRLGFVQMLWIFTVSSSAGLPFSSSHACCFSVWYWLLRLKSSHLYDWLTVLNLQVRYISLSLSLPFPVETSVLVHVILGHGIADDFILFFPETGSIAQFVILRRTDK